MAYYKAWFDHPDGPYSVDKVADSQEDIEEAYRDDPYFLYVTTLDDPETPKGSPSLHLFGYPE